MPVRIILKTPMDQGNALVARYRVRDAIGPGSHVAAGVVWELIAGGGKWESASHAGPG